MPARIIVYGVGAIGGTVAAALVDSGQEVIGIARGAQLDAIRAKGLTLRAPRGAVHVRFPCVAGPEEIAFRPDDMILLTMKSQDTGPALDRLSAMGVRSQPIFCMQNGVANEPLALRRFANVHGVTVMMPSAFLDPGNVVVFAEPRYGIFDLGRYPRGSDGADTALAQALEKANITTHVQQDVMASKYGKLLKNLGNILQAALGPEADRADLSARVLAEAVVVLKAAGIPWRDVGDADPRRAKLLRMTAVDGLERNGGSTVQSLMRGTGTIETLYLNGEIVLLGRMHDVATPMNSYLCQLAGVLARDKRPPGSVTHAEIEAGIAAYLAS